MAHCFASNAGEAACNPKPSPVQAGLGFFAMGFEKFEGVEAGICRAIGVFIG